VAHDQSAAAAQLRLPVLIFGKGEVRRLKRELDALEDFARQSAIREPGKQAAMPRVSRLLEALATENGLQLLQVDHRQQLKQFLTAIEEQAPGVHISFAVDPSSAFTAKMVTWLRANIHPYMLLEVGLQPTIAIGCVVRTTNKVFDFSLRERFAQAEGLLMKSLDAVAADAQSAQSLAAPATAVGTPAALQGVVIPGEAPTAARQSV